MLWCEGLYGLSYYGIFGLPKILVTGPSVDLGQILLKMLVLAFACACTPYCVQWRCYMTATRWKDLPMLREYLIVKYLVSGQYCEGASNWHAKEYLSVQPLSTL